MAIRKPKIEVVDAAIREIETSSYTLYSCIALWEAALEAHPSATSYSVQKYEKQYEKYVESVNKGKLPPWWNDKTFGRAPRLKALRGFKRAMIKAAQKKAQQ